MAWHRTGDKPLSKPMMTQFNDAYMRHSASLEPERNGPNFADVIFKHIFLNEKFCIDI